MQIVDTRFLSAVDVERENIEALEGDEISMTCSAPEGATMSYYKDSKLLVGV